MDAVLDLLTLLVFVGVILLVLTIRSLRGKKQLDKAVVARFEALKESLGGKQVADEAAGILRDIDQAPGQKLPLIGEALARIWINLGLVGWQQNLRVRLIVLGLISLFIGGALGRQTPLPLTMTLILALAAFAGLFYVFYKHALGKHLKELQASLPEAIDAITRAARAGVPVSNAFAMVAKNIPGSLAREFGVIDNWLKLGMPLKQAISDSARRVPLPEYRFFAVIVIINQEAGGRLGETLDRLASTLRERAELALKVQSKTSEARASAKIVASLVPLALAYMYFNSPRDFHFLLNDPTGNKVLIYAFGSVVTGLIITHRMVRRVS